MINLIFNAFCILPEVSLFLVVQTPLFVSFLQPSVDPEIAERSVTHNKNVKPNFGVPCWDHGKQNMLLES